MSELVTCVMGTYGRFPEHGWMVEEAVESFLRQTWENKHLIILNDCPGQTLKLSHPQIDVVNFRERYRNLADMWIDLITMASGDLVCQWDDDDVHLPHRIEFCVGKLGDRDMWLPKGLWQLHEDGHLEFKPNWGMFDMGIVRRSAVLKVAPDVQRVSNGFDWILANAIYRYCRGAADAVTAAEAYYVYRLGQHSLSVATQKDPQAYEKKAGHVPGTYEIQPHWTRDWEAFVAGQA